MNNYDVKSGSILALKLIITTFSFWACTLYAQTAAIQPTHEDPNASTKREELLGQLQKMAKDDRQCFQLLTGKKSPDAMTLESLKQNNMTIMMDMIRQKNWMETLPALYPDKVTVKQDQNSKTEFTITHANGVDHIDGGINANGSNICQELNGLKAKLDVYSADFSNKNELCLQYILLDKKMGPELLKAGIHINHKDKITFDLSKVKSYEENQSRQEIKTDSFHMTLQKDKNNNFNFLSYSFEQRTENGQQVKVTKEVQFNYQDNKCYPGGVITKIGQSEPIGEPSIEDCKQLHSLSERIDFNGIKPDSDVTNAAIQERFEKNRNDAMVLMNKFYVPGGFYRNTLLSNFQAITNSKNEPQNVEEAVLMAREELQSDYAKKREKLSYEDIISNPEKAHMTKEEYDQEMKKLAEKDNWKVEKNAQRYPVKFLESLLNETVDSEWSYCHQNYTKRMLEDNITPAHSQVKLKSKKVIHQ